MRHLLAEQNGTRNACTASRIFRTLALVEARHGFSLAPQYIHTQANPLADDLSRNLLSSFLIKDPQADAKATLLPAQLVDLLLDRTLDWMSPRWLQLFRGTFEMDWHHPLDALTTQR